MAVNATRLAWLATLTIALVLATGGAAAAPVTLAYDLAPSTTTLGAPDLDPKPVGHTATLTAAVTLGATGDVTFYDNGVQVASVPLTASTAVYTIPAYAPPGAHTITAGYRGDAKFSASTSQPRPVTVGPRPVTLTIGVSGPRDAAGATAQQGDVLRVVVGVRDGGTSGRLSMAGTITVWADGRIECGGPVPVTVCHLPTGGWPLGARSVRATYDPLPLMYAGAEHAAGSAAALRVMLVANRVEAVALPPSYRTVYPVADGYRDTTSLGGRRDEAASVNVRVISPAGRVVRQAEVPLGVGAWSVTWDGRNDAGRTLATGRYTVQQRVTDSLGATKTLSSVVLLSGKRLHTHTATLEKTYQQTAVNRATAEGWIGWQFTLPSAAVYTRLAFAVNGKSGVPLGRFGPHDYGLCPSTRVWDWASCMSPNDTFPSSSSWKSVAGSATGNRHGRTVRMYAIGGNQTQVAHARVTVTYEVLQ